MDWMVKMETMENRAATEAVAAVRVVLGDQDMNLEELADKEGMEIIMGNKVLMEMAARVVWEESPSFKTPVSQARAEARMRQEEGMVVDTNIGVYLLNFTAAAL